LARNLDAFSARIELHAVVHASDIVAFDPAHRERRRAMATAVVERGDFAAGASVNNDRPLQNGAGQLVAVDQFVIPGRNVPGIPQKNSVIRHYTLRDRGTRVVSVSISSALPREPEFSGHTLLAGRGIPA